MRLPTEDAISCPGVSEVEYRHCNCTAPSTGSSGEGSSSAGTILALRPHPVARSYFTTPVGADLPSNLAPRGAQSSSDGSTSIACQHARKHGASSIEQLAAPTGQADCARCETAPSRLSPSGATVIDQEDQAAVVSQSRRDFDERVGRADSFWRWCPSRKSWYHGAKPDDTAMWAPDEFH